MNKDIKHIKYIPTGATHFSKDMGRLQHFLKYNDYGWYIYNYDVINCWSELESLRGIGDISSLEDKHDIDALKNLVRDFKSNHANTYGLEGAWDDIMIKAESILGQLG